MSAKEKSGIPDGIKIQPAVVNIYIIDDSSKPPTVIIPTHNNGVH